MTFEDVAATAGVLDHGAGMSAAFLDYDNDGLLDIYTGNMWSASGLRVTTSPAFMPDAPPEVRALYRRHARGNSLFRNRGDGRFDDRTLEARAEMGRWAWSSDALDFDSDGWEDLYVANGMLTRKDGPTDLDGFFWRQVVARSPLTPRQGHAVRRCVARDQPVCWSTSRSPAGSATCSCAMTGRAASTRSRERRASISIRTAARSRCSTSIATAIRTSR